MAAGVLACGVASIVVLFSAWVLQGSRKRDSGLSCLYTGRVWHVRFLPAVHKFAYGLFYTFLDLDHLDGTFKGLWPLASHKHPAIGRFCESDHLKDVEEDKGLPIAERVRRLVQRETGVRPEGPICLMTHLSYMGYCFNPVSFYYCMDASGQKLETVVAEVSNTPWNEMHCYVLDPRSKGVKASLTEAGEKGERRWNYVFQKEFHVSPFMDMEHTYDWDFVDPLEGVWVSTAMLKGGNRWFQARFDLNRRPMNVGYFLWVLVRYPLITWAVQFLIHLQALRLWLKKVPFYPHPEGSTTWASRAVGIVMAPLWKLQAWMSK